MRSKQLFIIYKQRMETCTAVLYSQTTDKGNEPDGKIIEYTDKRKVSKSPEKNKFFGSFDEDIEHGISSDIWFVLPVLLSEISFPSLLVLPS